MIELNKLKPKEIKETDFEAYLDLHADKYPDYYRDRYLKIKKYKNNITFFEIFHRGDTYEEYPLTLDLIKWLLNSKRIERSRKIKLLINLTNNE